MDKCHQQLCDHAAEFDITCPDCNEHFCTTAHLTYHVSDGHTDRGMITRGKTNLPKV